MEQPIQMLNKVELLGRIGRVDIQNVNNTRVAKFSVVTEYLYESSKEEGSTYETTWHNCVLWERWAGQLDGLAKGLPVHLTGRIRTRSYNTLDNEMGITKTRYITEIIVSDLQLTAADVRLTPQK